MKILLLTCFICLACLTAHAQNKKALDSLMRVYNTAKHDTTKVLALTSIAFEYSRSKPDTNISIAEKALTMSEKIGFEKGKGWAWNRMGIGYYSKGKYNEALVLYRKALPVFEKIQEKKGISNSLAMIGNIYLYQGNHSLALEYQQKSLKIQEEIGDKTGIASNLNDIGNICLYQSNYPLALEYYQKSLKIQEGIGDKTGIASSSNNIGNIYLYQSNYPLALEYYQKSLKTNEELGDKKSKAINFNNIGEIYEKKGNYPLALEYYQKSLKIREGIGNKGSIANSLNNIGNIYLYQGNYPLALEYYQKALKIKEEIGDKWGMTYPLRGIAQVAQKQKDYDKSITYAQRSLQIAQEFKVPDEIKNASITLYETYKLKGDYAKALEAHELYKQSNDSIFNVEKSKAIANLEATVEIEKKELQLQKEKERYLFQQYILYLVGLGFFLLIIFAFFILRSRRRINQERQKSDRLLLNILPTEVAHELKETGKTDVRYFESVTVLFADVKGFSALATKISPQALIAELDAIFSKMDEISVRFGLERIKTIGDCYMACGGLPHANKTHPFDVVLTALNIQHWMNEERKKNPDFWQVRLGAHTGDAVAGVIGKTKFAYDIWGNTVNLASRMESGGEVGKVNVTQQTFEAVQDYFEGSYREEIEAKNIGKVKAYSITRLKPEYSIDALGFEPNERFWEVYRSL